MVNKCFFIELIVFFFYTLKISGLFLIQSVLYRSYKNRIGVLLVVYQSVLHKTKKLSSLVRLQSVERTKNLFRCHSAKTPFGIHQNFTF